MKNTFFTPPAGLKCRIAATEFCRWRKRILIGEVHDENAYALGGIGGNAGSFSTAYDLEQEISYRPHPTVIPDLLALLS